MLMQPITRHVGAILVDAAPAGCDDAIPRFVAATRKIDDRDADAAHGRQPFRQALAAQPR